MRSTLLRLTGRDALALLHRITTQHLRELPAGGVATTLFCDFRGRVLHRVAVARTADAIWLARPDAPGDELAAAIDAQVFRDDVRIEDLSERHAVHAASEPGAVPGTLTWGDARPRALHLARGITWLVGDPPAAPLTEPDRIRVGAPRHGREIAEAFNPYEIDAVDDVHLDKGCFTGQEALLRMHTYKGVRRRLARVEGTGAPPASGVMLRHGDADAGVITSAAATAAGWIALAVVRNDAVDAALALGGTALTRLAPFPQRQPNGLPA
jgi:folate-binding protein YgfZ